MTKKLFYCLILGALVFMACASSGSGTGPKGPVSYRGKAGDGTVSDVRRKTEWIFSKYGYEVVRQEESYDSFYFETNWKYRSPFEDEAALNVISGRTRIIIQTRPKLRSAVEGATDIHSVEVMGENQVKYAGSEEWVNMIMTEQLKTYFSNFTKELEIELRSSSRY